jgi:hypothetical protein
MVVDCLSVRLSVSRSQNYLIESPCAHAKRTTPSWSFFIASSGNHSIIYGGCYRNIQPMSQGQTCPQPVCQPDGAK